MSQEICPGDGTCLNQVDFNLYAKKEQISCLHSCGPINCPNYRVCGNSDPKYIMDCHNGLCVNCDILFKYLVFTEDEECSICFETKLHVKQLNCIHKICIDCFKRCYLPPYWDDPQPQFPYSSDIEDEYENNREDLRWRLDSLIQKYEKNLNEWFNTREKKEDSEKYLKQCSQCRK